MPNADFDRATANDGPEIRLLAMMLGVAGTQLIGLAAQLNIADLLNDGPYGSSRRSNYAIRLVSTLTLKSAIPYGLLAGWSMRSGWP
jgi:hypothetical protein